MEELRDEILHRLATRRDEEYRVGLGRTLGPAVVVIGVRVPAIRELVKLFSAEHPDLTPFDAVRLFDLLSADRVREEFLFAVFFLARCRRKLSSAVWADIDRWVDRIDNWETCDQLAMCVAGDVVRADLSLIDDLVGWARSANRWRRRFTAAATTVLNQRGQSHAKETFRVCEVLMQDNDPVVQSAVAWAIREASKKDPRAAVEFLNGWKGVASPKVLREGSRLIDCAGVSVPGAEQETK